MVKGCVLVDTSSPGHTAGLQDYRPVGGQDQRVPPSVRRDTQLPQFHIWKVRVPHCSSSPVIVL